MFQKKIIFRADGNSKTGLGHLYRLFSLVEIIKSTYQFEFVTSSESTISVIPKNYNLKLKPNNISLEEEPTWLKKNYKPENNIIIADGYHFNSNYQKAIKSLGFNLIYIDDLATEHMFADVVVNHSPYFKEQHFNIQSFTFLALGTNYAMLRPVFLEAARASRNLKQLDTIFICFGGSDPYDLSLKALKAAVQIEQIKKIEIVLGAAYSYKEIFDLQKNYDNVSIHQNLDANKLCEIMKNCHLAIAPSSTILYELCAVKMPILSGYYVDNQKFIYQSLKDKGIIFKAEDFRDLNEEDFKNKLEQILKFQDIKSILLNQKKMFDGNSSQRLIGLVNRLNISFRDANIDDAKLIFNWSNDALVRQQSYNTDKIDWSEHKKWFEKNIQSKDSIMHIALINNQPAGLVRYSLTKDHAIVGILISKAYRGQKLAPKILEESASLFFKTQDNYILAYIKKSNIASVKTFQKANYKYFKDDVIKGNSSFVYKLEKENE